jgi:hypothetical protein
MDAESQPVPRSDLPEAQAGGPWQLGQDGRYYSPDGRYWWDGWAWRPLPRGPIGRWATAHPGAYPALVAVVVGIGWGAVRLSTNVVFGAGIPSPIVLAYWASIPGAIGWFTARGQIKRWGARS